MTQAPGTARKAEGEIRLKTLELDLQKKYQLDPRIGIPWNQDTVATLTDFYQITMAYAYWNANRHDKWSVFEVFFRTSPFEGEYTVFAGVNDVLRFVNTFHFDQNQANFLQSIMPTSRPEFFQWLAKLDCSEVTIHSVPEGTLVFPREPVMRIEGPLAICQLLETAILNLLNFASLMATNAARHRLAAGWNKQLFEFGLRRAQGPDGGMTASRYAFLGGFDATSNVRASFLFGIPCKGTHAHAFVTAFKSIEDLPKSPLEPRKDASGLPFVGRNPGARAEGQPQDGSLSFTNRVLEIKKAFMAGYPNVGHLTPSESELMAFIAYGMAFPNTFLALIDTYDVLLSGVPNFVFVAIALIDWGYSPAGVRLDSGDLSYLSVKARALIDDMARWMKYDLSKCVIVASNNINEEVLRSINQQPNEIDVFGIGTHLVTCYNQPALGMIYKLCEIDGEPTMKISQELSKTTLPCPKDVYRLYDARGIPILDLVQLSSHPPPKPGFLVYCQHITDSTKRCNVVPTSVERLLKPVWRKGKATRFALSNDLLAFGGGKSPLEGSSLGRSPVGSSFFDSAPASSVAGPGGSVEGGLPLTKTGDLLMNDSNCASRVASPMIAANPFSSAPTQVKAPSTPNFSTGSAPTSADRNVAEVRIDRKKTLEENQILDVIVSRCMSPPFVMADEEILNDDESVFSDYDGQNHLEYLLACRRRCTEQLRLFRDDILRFSNPTPYKVSVTREYYDLYKSLWDRVAPVRTYQ